MNELHDKIMEDIGQVIHDYYDKHWPDSCGYGDNVHANAIVDGIAEKVKDLCDRVESSMVDTEGSRDDLIDERDCIANELEGREAEIEDMEQEKELTKMKTFYWSYVEAGAKINECNAR